MFGPRVPPLEAERTPPREPGGSAEWLRFVIDHLPHMRLHCLFLSVPAAIAILRGPDLVCELVNERARELLDGADVMGRPLREVVPDEEDPRVRLVRAALASGREARFHGYRTVRPDGRGGQIERWFDGVLAPLIDAEGRPEGAKTARCAGCRRAGACCAPRRSGRAGTSA